MHHNKKKVLAACLAMTIVASVQAQEQIVYPDINYAGSNTCNKTYAGISSDSSSVFKSNICFCTCYPSAKTG